MRGLKDLYFLAFYVLCRVGLLDTARERQWKGLVAIALLQVWVLIALDAWLRAATGASWLLDLPKPAIVAICLFVIALNYWGLLHRERWRVFAGTFERLTPDEQGRWIRAAWFIIIAIVAACLTLVAVLRRPTAG